MSSIQFKSLIANPKILGNLAKSAKEVGSLATTLSLGSRLQDSSSDAAAMALSEKLSSNKAVYTKGIQNVNDAITLISVTDNALDALDSIAGQLSDLAEIAEGTLTPIRQRDAVNEEALSLAEEYNRIVDNSKYGGQKIFNSNFGNISVQVGYGTTGKISTDLQLSQAAVVSDAWDGVSILFTEGQTFTINGSGSIPSSTLTADINNDGYDDVLVADSNSARIATFLGSSGGVLTASTSLTVVGSISEAVTGDFNNDGNIDVAAGFSLSGPVSVFLGNGNGTFGARSDYAIARSDSISVADLNNDGRDDLVTTNSATSSFSVFLANANGTFQAPTTTTQVVGGSTVGDVVFGDFDEDTKIDLLLVRYGGGGTSLFIGNGDGNFKAPTASIPNSGNMVVHDLNGDGFEDVASGSEFFLGNGNGTFGGAQTLTNQPFSASLAVDFDGDGNVDLVGNMGGFTDRGIVLGNGDGTFKDIQTFTYSDNGSFSVGDFNNDGINDLFTSGRGTSTAQINTTPTSASLSNFSSDYIAEIQSTVDLEQGRVSAFLSRLESSLGNLTATTNNLDVAIGRIRDIDPAQELTDYLKAKIRSDSGTALLAQAGLDRDRVLSLLDL